MIIKNLKFGTNKLDLKKDLAFFQFFFLAPSDLKSGFAISIRDLQKLVARINKLIGIEILKKK